VRVTIKDIANEVGVSHPTVSKALANLPGVNEETRKRILEVAKKLNYVPNVAAQRLAKRKSRSIGFIWNSNENLFLYHLCNKLQAEAKKRNIDVLITMSEPSEAITNLYNHCVDFVFCWGKKTNGIENKIREYVKNGCHFIFVDRNELSCADSVCIDRFTGIYESVCYLHSMGHRNLLFVGKESDKKKGFESAVKELEIKDKCYSFDIESDYYLDYHEYEKELTIKFFRVWDCVNRPTAIILDSQNLAMGFLNVFKKLNISIPEDLSLITYDDIPEYSVYPVALTTISPSVSEIARKVVERFEDYYSGKNSEQISLKIVPELKIRDSVKRIIQQF